MANKKIALISEKMPTKIAGIFENLGYGCVCLSPHPALATPVAHHPDILFSVLDSGEVLCDGEYLNNSPKLLELGISFRASVRRLGKRYPEDVAFDALVIGDTVYGKINFIAPEILENRKTVNVKQGYTLCSTLIADRTAITADAGIYGALNESGVNCLRISADGVLLDGYDSGFIGGASAYDAENDTVVFFGNIKEHPDFEKINAFLTESGHKILYPEDIPLSDYGGAKLIKI